MQRRLRRSLGSWALALLGLGIGVLVGIELGSRTVSTHPMQPIPAKAVTVQARSGTLVSIRNDTVTASWRLGESLPNRLNGTVTTVGLNPDRVTEVGAGTLLYSISMVPVVAAEGDLPAYRDMTLGQNGPDIAQFQTFLSSQGFPSRDPVGEWRQPTTTAYHSWLAARRFPDADVVKLGSIVFFPKLPVSVFLGKDVRRGAEATAGSIALQVLDKPKLSIATDGSSPRPGTRVTVRVSDRNTLEATVSSRQQVDPSNGMRSAELDFGDASSGAQVWWNDVALTGETTWPAEVVDAGPQTGVIVPVGALRFDAAGAPSVMREDGSIVPVELGVQVGGEVVVTGLSATAVLRLPGQSDAALPSETGAPATSASEPSARGRPTADVLS